jgi:predicted neutral ceramidase superfamily lipid hydrolase
MELTYLPEIHFGTFGTVGGVGTLFQMTCVQLQISSTVTKIPT